MRTRKAFKPLVALCYIRQSWTRDENDLTSPERQKSNITRVCKQNGWMPEWYEDVGGHKSGTSEDNRPQWLALKKRIGDADVAAVVANDLSRLHRNLSNISSLIETLERQNLKLILAASNSDIDVTTLTGQMFAQMRGLMDAFYAKDISAKAKDSIKYRKRQGKTIGMAPFGTQRNENGYLVPGEEGAWLMPDGTFVSGSSDEQPDDRAVWRSYYDCAHRILKIYVTKKLGMQRISYMMNSEGWAFRDRKRKPRPVTEDDIRRVLCNWPEYGGMVFDKKAKDRKAYEDYDVDELSFNEERAVFPVELLKSVGRNRKKRSIRPVNHGINKDAYSYPLGGLLYCAHCEQLAKQHNNPKLRTHLGGSASRGKHRYRHIGGVKCGAVNRSIHCSELDYDFGRLVKLLTIRPEALDLMTELSIQIDKEMGKDDVDIEAEKQASIALCRRRIDASVNLYRDGMISREDYLADVDRNEREIAHWETRNSETKEKAAQLVLCMEAVNNLARMWDISDDSERQSLAQGLFTELTFDLNTRRIVHFKLKPWADRFLTLRTSLYPDIEIDNDDIDGEGGANTEGVINLNEKLMDVWQEMGRRPVWGIDCLKQLFDIKTTTISTS